jgi:hypothetical protein
MIPKSSTYAISLVIVALLFVCTGTRIQAQAPLSNMRIVGELLDSVANVVPGYGGTDVIVRAHPDSLWLQAIIQQHLLAKHQYAVPQSGNETREKTTVIVPTECGVEFCQLETPDSVQRKTTIRAVLSRQGVNPMAVHYTTTDTIAVAMVPVVQNFGYVSTVGVLPPAESSVWDDLLTPMLFVGAAVATVVLLFTVRSQ